MEKLCNKVQYYAKLMKKSHLKNFLYAILFDDSIHSLLINYTNQSTIKYYEKLNLLFNNHIIDNLAPSAFEVK